MEDMNDQWHKFAALIMQKLNVTRVVLTIEDIEKMACLPEASTPTILAHHHHDSIEVMLLPRDQVVQYMNRHAREKG